MFKDLFQLFIIAHFFLHFDMGILQICMCFDSSSFSLTGVGDTVHTADFR